MSNGTLPFTLSFVPVPQTPQVLRPGLQSYCWLTQGDGNWFMLGGRRQGLHGFGTEGENFPGPNPSILYCNPVSGSIVDLFDLTTLPPELGDPLMASSQQFYYDADADEWLIVGGYGHDSQLGQDRTFDTLIRIPVGPFRAALFSDQTPQQKAVALQNSMVVTHDPFFAVTGGVLRKLGGRYLLIFGQGFQGAYNPFEGIVAQTYTEAVRFFRFDPQRRVFGKGEITSPDLDQPFHRRDLPVVNSIDPDTGNPRLVAFGGVFPPGMLDGYFNPVYVSEAAGQLMTITDRTVTKLFNQYVCPVVVVWDPNGQAVYHTFFGGISRSFYFQTADQSSVYRTNTAQGRNDGLPYVADISTLTLAAGGAWSEYIAPAPIADNRLCGTSTDFIPVPNNINPAVSPDGIVNLSQISPDNPVLVGYIYGGIEAIDPLPLIPGKGTVASNSLFQVMISTAPASGYLPASAGTLANGVVPPNLANTVKAA
jgi:hypothetical protein